MKVFYFFIAFSILSILSFSQAPLLMSYQMVVRNSQQQLIMNSLMGMRISILQGSSMVYAVYSETQNANTNSNGLLTAQIGAGSNVTGNLAGIDWSNGPYFIKIEIDINGGTNYTMESTSQLLTVPFAFHSNTCEETKRLKTLINTGL